LVRTGIWSVDLGANYDALWELRDLGDYGDKQHVTTDDAAAALEAARRIHEDIRRLFPNLEKS